MSLATASKNAGKKTDGAMIFRNRPSGRRPASPALRRNRTSPVLRRTRVAMLFLAVTLVTVGAAAQPSAADQAAADVLYQEGKKLMKENKYAEACAKFAE